MSTEGGLATDLGNVIIAYWLSDITPENFHLIDYNSIPEVPGAFESLKRLNRAFNGNVAVIYKATGVAHTKIHQWLYYHRFSERTGISMNHVIHSKGGRNKALHLNELNQNYQSITTMVDDRLEVLSYFVGKVPNLFLFRPQSNEVEQFRNTGALPYVKIVQT